MGGGKKGYNNYGKTFRKPKRPFEKERLGGEMKIVGEYGLKNKREVWRVQYALAKIRSAAKIMERRLQTKVFKLGLAKSIHHARTLIRQRHIRVGKQICDIPSFLVRVDSEKHIDFALTSPFGGGRPGRVRRKQMGKKGGGGGDGGDDDE